MTRAYALPYAAAQHLGCQRGCLVSCVLKSGRPNSMRTMIDAASYARTPEITLKWTEMTTLMNNLIRPVFFANASLENALAEMNHLIDGLLSD